MPLLDKLREQYGVGPVCSELHIAPSTYYHCQQQRHHPDKRSARAQRDDWLKREIQRVYDENHQVYGVRKVCRQLLREGIRVARCTVARLMAVMGLAGVLRGKTVRTTASRKTVAAGDRVNRQFVAERPDQLWGADFTYVSTWQGFVYVAFIIDVFAGYIVGWRVSSSMETTLVLDALEQALWARRPSGTIHHSDKGSQYVSLAYTQRLKEACTKCNCIVEAPAPSRPIERGIAGPGLLARVLTGKYCEHLPLYRQSEIFARQGVELSHALLSNWVDACCQLMTPLNDALYRYVMNTCKLHTDDTSVKVLAPGRKKAKTGYIWTYVRDDRNAGSPEPPAVWFAYSPDHQGKHPEQHFRPFRGILQADAFNGYDRLFC